MLPKDIHMLVSYLNTKLRDDDMSLEHIIETQNGNVQEVLAHIDQSGYTYDESLRQIKHR